MCATLCGPPPNPPSTADTIRRLYVDRAPATALEEHLLTLYDRLSGDDQQALLTRTLGPDTGE